MKGYTKWSALALTAGMAMVFSSCAVHRPPRTHRHHPHSHTVVIVAEQTASPEQNSNRMTFEEWLAMTESESYGSTE